MQYISEFCPANWYSELQFEQKKQIFIEKLNTDTLKSIIGVKQEDLDILEDLFEKELQSAIDYVAKDVDDNLYDSVDVQTRESIRKKVKLCSSGHINENVRSNRTICDRQNCKSNLEEANDVIEKRLEKKPINDDLDQQQKRARKYLNVPNIELEDTPKELAVGAIAVNPNKPDRVSKVLDTIIEAADMKNKFAVKIVLSGNTVKKIINPNEDFRKFVVVTADGLPYKMMIDLIKNSHTCALCGKTFRYLADITDHMKNTTHNEFFQTYGNILPNIGHFHYSLTMLRSLVKLLCQEKGTDF